jgi:uncharacterized protein YegP (UPF0339 family)
MKQTHIRISDARGGFRVAIIAKNGEMLMQSEILESILSVCKNLTASLVVNKAKRPMLDSMREAYHFRMPMVYTGKDAKLIKFMKRVSLIDKDIDAEFKVI